MAITTYAELQTAVANWLHRSDLTSYATDFITIAETRIFRKLRSRDMETSFSTAISSGVIALPSSYEALKYAYVDGTPVRWLDRKSAQWIYENYSTRSGGGKPNFIAREGSNFIFGPYPDSDYTIKGVYYKNLGPLSSSAHAVFTNNPDLYLYASLVAAEPFIKADKRLPMWKAMFEELLAEEQKSSDDEDHSAQTMRMTAG